MKQSTIGRKRRKKSCQMYNNSGKVQVPTPVTPPPSSTTISLRKKLKYYLKYDENASKFSVPFKCAPRLPFLMNFQALPLTDKPTIPTSPLVESKLIAPTLNEKLKIHAPPASPIPTPFCSQPVPNHGCNILVGKNGRLSFSLIYLGCVFSKGGESPFPPFAHVWVGGRKWPFSQVAGG